MLGVAFEERHKNTEYVGSNSSFDNKDAQCNAISQQCSKRVGFYRLQLSEEEMLGPWLAFQTESSS